MPNSLSSETCQPVCRTKETSALLLAGLHRQIPFTNNGMHLEPRPPQDLPRWTVPSIALPVLLSPFRPQENKEREQRG